MKKIWNKLYALGGQGLKHLAQHVSPRFAQNKAVSPNICWNVNVFKEFIILEVPGTVLGSADTAVSLVPSRPLYFSEGWGER